MECCLKLCKGDKPYLLTRSDSSLHIITADRRLTEETEKWLLSAPRTVEQMNKQQLSRFSMELSKIRGVSLGGLEAGNIIQFYLPEGKKRYTLADDVEQEAVDTLFSGLDWFTPPKIQAQEDWRLKHQRKEMKNVLFSIGKVLNIASWICSLGLILFRFRSGLLVAANLLLVVTCLVLYGSYPQYFTLFEKDKLFPKNSVRDLSLPLVLCPLLLGLAAFEYCKILAWWKASLMGIPIIIALAVLYWKRCPDFRDPRRLAGFLLTGVLLCGGPVLAANILLDFGPAETIHTDVLEVEREDGGRGADRYYVHVLVDGEQVRIPITGRQFRELEAGERVEIEIHDGALGISFVVYSP